MSMIMRAFALCCLAALAGCKDYGRCLSWHQELQYPYLAYSGSENAALRALAFVLQNVDVCDRYEFPEGR